MLIWLAFLKPYVYFEVSSFVDKMKVNQVLSSVLWVVATVNVYSLFCSTVLPVMETVPLKNLDD